TYLCCWFWTRRKCRVFPAWPSTGMNSQASPRPSNTSLQWTALAGRRRTRTLAGAEGLMSEMTPHDSSARPTARARGWLDEPVTRGEKTFVGGLKGFIGGGVAGYVGGMLLDRGAAHEQLLFGAGFGACIGILFGILALIAGGRLAAIK